MIRPLAESDFDAAIHIVNRNWTEAYAGYVNQDSLNDAGCHKRGRQLREDFINHRLSEYVWEESGQIMGLTRAIKFYQKYGYQIDKEQYLDTPYLTYGTRLLKNIS